jgi:hypothetical protein
MTGEEKGVKMRSRHKSKQTVRLYALSVFC